jgi:hypothetical protein
MNKYKCCFCDSIFDSTEGLIAIPDSVCGGRVLYFTAGYHGIHDLRKVSEEDLKADSESTSSLASLMALLEPEKEPEPAEKDLPVLQ